MKTIKRICILLALVLVICVVDPVAALTAHDDFEITLTVSPHTIAERGGLIYVAINVSNVGSTAITWVRVGASTTTPYSEQWNGSIAAGTSKTVTFVIPFDAADLNREILTAISMNNDDDADLDGKIVKMITVASEDNVFMTAGTTTPDKEVYYVGESIEINDTFRNTLPIEATNVTVEYYYRVDGETIYTPAPYSLSTVGGGATKSINFHVTLNSSHVGQMHIASKMEYLISDRGYYEEYNYAHEFEVQEAVSVVSEGPTIDVPILFTAELSVEPTEIMCGDPVTFSFDFENTGIRNIDYMEIVYFDTFIGTIPGMMPGVSYTYNRRLSIFGDIDRAFTIRAYSDDIEKTIETNPVRIEIIEPEEDETKDFTVTLTAEPSTISSGDTVRFTIDFENTGEAEVLEYNLFTEDGRMIGATESMAGGETGSISFDKEIFESREIFFHVLAMYADGGLARDTNTVNITAAEGDSSSDSDGGDGSGDSGDIGGGDSGDSGGGDSGDSGGGDSGDSGGGDSGGDGADDGALDGDVINGEDEDVINLSYDTTPESSAQASITPMPSESAALESETTLSELYNLFGDDKLVMIIAAALVLILIMLIVLVIVILAGRKRKKKKDDF